MTTNRNGWFGLAVVAAVLITGGTARAADHTWNSTSGGNWSDASAAGWNAGGYPNAQDDSATFSQDITANQTITIDVTDAKAGALTLDDTSPNYGWHLSGTNPRTFDSSSGTATVNVNGSGGYDANTHRISAPIVATNLLDFILGASGRLRLSGDNSGATGGMNISGGGSGGFVLFDSAASLGGAGNTITVASGAQAGLALCRFQRLARILVAAGAVIPFRLDEPRGTLPVHVSAKVKRVNVTSSPQPMNNGPYFVLDE